jgi:cyclopropane fatty-acyl-phospholipid synthase-like methyltransferase
LILSNFLYIFGLVGFTVGLLLVKQVRMGQQLSMNTELLNRRRFWMAFECMWTKYWHYGIFRDGDESFEKAQENTLDWIAEELKDTLQSSESRVVVELGCGIGSSLFYLSSRFDAQKVKWIGVERDPVQVMHMKQIVQDLSIENVSLLCQSIAQPIEGIEASSVDALYCNEVLCLLSVQDKTKVFQEVSRVLKPGGVFILTDVLRADCTGSSHHRPNDCDRVTDQRAQDFNRFLEHKEPMVCSLKMTSMLKFEGFVCSKEIDLSSHLKYNYHLASQRTTDSEEFIIRNIGKPQFRSFATHYADSREYFKRCQGEIAWKALVFSRCS